MPWCAAEYPVPHFSAAGTSGFPTSASAAAHAPRPARCSSGARDRREGFQNLGSRCGAVFVDEAAEEVVAFDRPGAWWIGSIDRFGRLKAACSMRASAVVVSRVRLEHVLEMSAADDQQPVETLGADGADEALGVGVCLWRTD